MKPGPLHLINEHKTETKCALGMELLAGWQQGGKVTEKATNDRNYFDSM